jgi:G3E family GTPase
MKTSADSQINSYAEAVLLSGFLGSGKTTLLKRILSWETDLAGTVVIVNEFGKVGIDGALLKETDLRWSNLPVAVFAVRFRLI